MFRLSPFTGVNVTLTRSPDDCYDKETQYGFDDCDLPSFGGFNERLGKRLNMV